MVYHAPRMKNRNNIYLGMFLLGITGILIGVVLESTTASLAAGALGTLIGGFVGWLGGRRYLVIICLGAVIGAVLGYQAGDKDILIMAAGSGAAISGFVANFIELFRKKP
jgi:hypothetical protein